MLAIKALVELYRLVHIVWLQYSEHHFTKQHLARYEYKYLKYKLLLERIIIGAENLP